jgi:hypothetical protein
MMQDEGLHEIFGRDYPCVSTVSKELTDRRNKDAARSSESKGLDAEWTIQSLSKYPIHPDALPAVLEVWFFVQNFKSEYKQMPSMTIRQAQWAARLYRVIQETKALLTYSQILANFERQAEITGLDYFGSQWTTLEVFSQMSGRKFTHEEKERITGLSGHYVLRSSTGTRASLRLTTTKKRDERKVKT